MSQAPTGAGNFIETWPSEDVFPNMRPAEVIMGGAQTPQFQAISIRTEYYTTCIQNKAHGTDAQANPAKQSKDPYRGSGGSPLGTIETMRPK